MFKWELLARLWNKVLVSTTHIRRISSKYITPSKNQLIRNIALKYFSWWRSLNTLVLSTEVLLSCSTSWCPVFLTAFQSRLMFHWIKNAIEIHSSNHYPTRLPGVRYAHNYMLQVLTLKLIYTDICAYILPWIRTQRTNPALSGDAGQFSVTTVGNKSHWSTQRIK